MPNDIDKSLLDRLQALRGASEPPESSPKISIDTIKRSKTPTKEDALAARLKSLRSQDDSPHASPTRPSKLSTPASASVNQQPSFTASTDKARDEDVDDAFQTDDKTLEDLLADVDESEHTFATAAEPDDAKVKALLEELADSIPQDGDEGEGEKKKEGVRDEEQDEGDDDDSDGEKMGKEVDDVMARYRDEVEMDRALGLDEEKEKSPGNGSPDPSHQPSDDDPNAALDLPSVPPDTTSSLPSVPSDLDSLTTRLAALRTASSSSQDPTDILPSVPTNKPSKQPNRLTSRTNYTDEDADSWCTVCLEDATLRCIGCDGDVYCARCWREMHVGERAGFEERSHKAVQFTRDRKTEKRKVAIGAS